MNSRSVPVIVIVLMVGLTGCAGIAPFGESTSTPESTTSQPEKKTTTADAISYPPGYAKSGITNPEKAAEQANAAPLEHDSFTLSMTASVPVRNTNLTINVSGKIDVSDKRVYIVANGSAFGSDIIKNETYYADGTVYKQNQLAFSRTTYSISQGSFQSYTGVNPSGKVSINGADSEIATQFKTANFSGAKQVTRNGETLFRYEASSVNNSDPFLFNDSLTNPSVDEFNATLLVDQEGIIKSFGYSITYTPAGGTQRTLTVRYQTTDIGSTTIEKPDWLDEAKAQTSNSSA
jgi:hypothetical protein